MSAYPGCPGKRLLNERSSSSNTTSTTNYYHYSCFWLLSNGPFLQTARWTPKTETMKQFFNQAICPSCHPTPTVPKHWQRQTLTRMWADAQRDGCPAEYRWRPMLKFRNSIPCTTPQSLADACVQCSNAANIGERKTGTQSQFCTWHLRGQEPPKMYIECTRPGDGQTLCKVWLTSVERSQCSNEAKTRNPL